MWWWIGVLAAGVLMVGYSLCAISAKADRDAQKMTDDWRKHHGTR